MHKIMMETTQHRNEHCLSVGTDLYTSLQPSKITYIHKEWIFSISIKLQEGCAAVEPSVGTLLQHVVGIGSPFFDRHFDSAI